jgi:hypothetical protein
MLLHFQGKCDMARCDHSADHQPASVFTCPAQVKALEAYLRNGILSHIDQILTPVGLVHIQHCECVNSVIAQWRRKGQPMAAVACFMLETFALLHWQQLQLANHGYWNHWRPELQDRVCQFLGLRGRGYDIALLDDELLSRLQRKKLRATAGKLEEKRQLKLKKLRAQSQGASGAYASGASDQAIERAATAAESQIHMDVDGPTEEDGQGPMDLEEQEGVLGAS